MALWSQATHREAVIDDGLRGKSGGTEATLHGDAALKESGAENFSPSVASGQCVEVCFPGGDSGHVERQRSGLHPLQKTTNDVRRKGEPVQKVPGELLQQKQMSELLQASGAASADGPGPDAGEPRSFQRDLAHVGVKYGGRKPDCEPGTARVTVGSTRQGGTASQGLMLSHLCMFT